MSKVLSSVHLDRSGTLVGLQSQISEAISGGAQGLLIFIGASSPLDLTALPDRLSALSVPAIAAVFPGVIYQDAYHEDAVLLCGLESPMSATVLTDIGKPEQELRKTIAEALDGHPHAASLLLILNGLSRNGDNLVTSLHDALGPEIQVSGAGCGSFEDASRASIITAEGLFSDAAVLIFQQLPLTVSARHGWTPVDGPFLITEATDNVIHQINYQPALDFYQTIVEKHHGEAVTEENFTTVANRYPFGLEQLDSEFLVRDPVAVDQQSLICAGAIPTHAMVYLLYAELDSLIDSAGSAAKWLTENYSTDYSSEPGLNVFVIDCISRRMVLGEKFYQELQAIRHNLPDQTDMVGVLSIGEVASSQQGGIQWLNKTTLVGGLAK